MSKVMKDMSGNLIKFFSYFIIFSIILNMIFAFSTGDYLNYFIKGLLEIVISSIILFVICFKLIKSKKVNNKKSK